MLLIQYHMFLFVLTESSSPVYLISVGEIIAWSSRCWWITFWTRLHLLKSTILCVVSDDITRLCGFCKTLGKGSSSSKLHVGKGGPFYLPAWARRFYIFENLVFLSPEQNIESSRQGRPRMPYIGIASTEFCKFLFNCIDGLHVQNIWRHVSPLFNFCVNCFCPHSIYSYSGLLC